MGRTPQGSRASIHKDVELLDYELYQMLLEEFMASKPNSSVIANHDQELYRQSERGLSQVRMAQRQENKDAWIAYYEQRVAQATGLTAYFKQRLEYVTGLEPDGSPPRRGAIVTHSQLGMGEGFETFKPQDRASFEGLPEPSKNGSHSVGGSPDTEQSKEIANV